MPGPAPAKVQHLAAQLTATAKQEVTPIWDEETGTWRIQLEQPVECSSMIHYYLNHWTKKDYTGCEGGHTAIVRLTFRRGGRKQGIKVWKLRATVQLDDLEEEAVPPSLIMKLLAKPTNPQGDGKVGGASEGSNKQAMSVKKTTVIRV
jgi:hypothetical protein